MADCTKVKHLSLHAARRALRAITRRDPARKKYPVAVYPCEHCRFWHLTSKKPSGRPRWWQSRS